jgi:hypothetical protein
MAVPEESPASGLAVRLEAEARALLGVLAEVMALNRADVWRGATARRFSDDVDETELSLRVASNDLDALAARVRVTELALELFLPG